MNWNLEGLNVKGKYMGDIPVSGKVYLSRVSHHIELDNPITVCSATRTHVILNHAEVEQVSSNDVLIMTGGVMDDLLKNLRALAKGKHDDFSVVFEAIREIERLQEMEAEIDRYCDSHCVWTGHDEKCVRNDKYDGGNPWQES